MTASPTPAEMLALADWIREPDHAENFSLDDMVDWINRRPIATVTRLASSADRWMPIESAPKDRSTLLLYEDENEGLGPFIGYWSGIQWLPLTARAFWEAKPTHWRPLPPAPQQGEARQTHDSAEGGR